MVSLKFTHTKCMIDQLGTNSGKYGIRTHINAKQHINKLKEKIT